MKTWQIVFTLFRSTDGAARFATLRSHTDTLIKNRLSVLDALNFTANLNTD